MRVERSNLVQEFPDQEKRLRDVNGRVPDSYNPGSGRVSQLYSSSAVQPSDWTAEMNIVGLSSTALVCKQRFLYINGSVSLSIIFVRNISNMTKFRELAFAPQALKLW